MYRGRIVELAPSEALFTQPVHPYTKALLSAMPRIAPGERIPRIPFDESKFTAVPLQEIDAGHFAAV